MRILLFDNQDSFTWNLAHEIERVDSHVSVEVKTALQISELDLKVFVSEYDAVIISPGPGMPAEAPLLNEVLSEAINQELPVLGICLGMQAVVEHFGGELENLEHVLHGRVSQMHGDEGWLLFDGVEMPCQVGHYHSWVASVENFPETELQVKARNQQGLILAISHLSLPITGFQFHPESILTPDGRLMLSNWLQSVKD